MKEQIYFILGSVALAIGANMIHPGLGILLVGILFLYGSCVEHLKDNEDD